MILADVHDQHRGNVLNIEWPTERGPGAFML